MGQVLLLSLKQKTKKTKKTRHMHMNRVWSLESMEPSL